MTTLLITLLFIFGIIVFIGLIRVVIKPSDSLFDLFMELLLIDLLCDLLGWILGVIVSLIDLDDDNDW